MARAIPNRYPPLSDPKSGKFTILSIREILSTFYYNTTDIQCAREQMGIRANGNLVPKFIASYSRANGNSSKWECSQKNHAEWLKMGTFLVKWDSFEHSNAPKHQNGKPISLQVIREQMGIRANGNIPEISCILLLNGIPFARKRTVDPYRRIEVLYPIGLRYA